MTGFNTQMCMKEGVYRIQFETTNKVFFDAVQDAARACIDGERRIIMAEVKTYKCDICGKVWTADPDDRRRIVMTRQPEKNGRVINYDDICPDCVSMLNECIEDPTILISLRQQMDREHNQNHKDIYVYKSLIGKIYREITHGSLLLYHSDGAEEYEAYAEKILEEVREMKDLHKGVLKWKRIAGSAIGFAIGMFLYFLIKAIC